MSKVKNPFVLAIVKPDGSNIINHDLCTFAITALSILSAESNAYKVQIARVFLSVVFFLICFS